jgi:hypothetical protein
MMMVLAARLAAFCGGRGKYYQRALPCRCVRVKGSLEGRGHNESLRAGLPM